MKENIRFRGLTLNKDEQSAEHGELALCAGVEMHDGALMVSVLQGSDIGTIPGTLLYVHVTASYEHYISLDDNYLKWSEKSDGSISTRTITNTLSNIISVTSIGNTLIVMTNTGVHYVLWKDTDYKYLGNEFPFVRLQFRPTENKKGDYDRSTLPSVHTEFVQDPQRYDAWRSVGENVYANAFVEDVGGINVANIRSDEGKQSVVTEAVWALINQTNNTIAKDGHFYAPFMIRYCYRLYDGSMVMHSAPVFMDVSLPLTYKVYSPSVQQRTTPDEQGFYPIIVNGDDIYINIKEDGTGDAMFDTDWFTLRYRPNNVGISFKLANDEAWNTLKNDWSDIVMSVDIFVTPPVTREDSSQIIKRMVVENPQYGVRGSNLETWSTTYNSWEYGGKTYTENLIFEIPKLSDEAYLDKILGQNTFYKIKSFNLEDKPSTSWTEMSYDKSIIPYIAAQEQMTDDYKTHNRLLPLTVGNSGMYVYNHRLNVYGIQEKLFAGFAIGDMVNQCSGSNTVTVTKVMVELNTESGKKYVENTVNVTIPEYILCNTPLFYPDSRAVRMVIYYGSNRAVSFNMEACALLNGAITMPQFLQQRISGSVAANTITYDVSNLVPMPNKVYTSEVDNPFYFPLNGINTIGTGSIIGIAAVTRALSQGQVGDHDLIVFATDGIWVMKVSSTGTYSAMHNISREVCSWKGSICQLDQSVTFATKRALSRFVESDIIPMSEELDGPVPKWIPDAVQQQAAPLLQSSPRRSASNSYVGWPVRLFTEQASPISMTIEHDISLLDNASPKELVFVIGTTSQPSIEKFFLRGHRIGDAADVKVYFDQSWTFDGYGADDYNDPNTGHPRTDTVFHISNGDYYAYVDHGSYYTFDDLGAEDPTQGSTDYITPSVNSLSFAQAGEAKTFGISSNVSWAISKSSGSDWLTVSPDSGSNDDTISVVAAANSGDSSRTATLTISDGTISATVSISQAGTTPTPPGPEPPTPTPGDGLLPDLAVFFANNPEILRLLRFGTPAVEMFNSGKVVYDHAGMRVIVLPQLPIDDDAVALVWSTRDRTWSTMNIPALKAVVAGYPYPFVQDSDGKVMILDKPYGYESGAGSEKPGLIITRTLTFSDTMDVLRGFLHYSDSEKAPTIFLYGSNDQRTWKPLGRTNRWFYNYLPGHPFRWFRLAVYMEMKPSEEYQQLELEIINKFAKL